VPSTGSNDTSRVIPATATPSGFCRRIDEAAIALRKSWTFPQVTEQHFIGELNELRVDITGQQ
jgi:hypothetical protein